MVVVVLVEILGVGVASYFRAFRIVVTAVIVIAARSATLAALVAVVVVQLCIRGQSGIKKIIFHPCSQQRLNVFPTTTVNDRADLGLGKNHLTLFCFNY